jgi:hypothetical protein
VKPRGAAPAPSVGEPAARADIRPWRPGDEESICRLFQRTFGREKPVDHWRWQFLGQGGEPHVMVARDDTGEIIAHFGGVARRMQVGGEPCVFSVAVDSMVAPERRAGLQRRGLFANVVERWVAHVGRSDCVAVGYGLPNPEALRLGRKLLGYSTLGEVVVQALPLGEPGVPAASDASDADPVAATREPEPDHDELWKRCRRHLPVSAIRDRAFLAWRWAACPGGDFQFLSARHRGRLAAVAVYSPTYTESDGASLADLLWDRKDPAALAACIARAAALARAAGRRYLVALLPDRSPEACALRELGFRAALTGHPFVARSFDPSMSLPWLAKRWYFTFADFDLV